MTNEERDDAIRAYMREQQHGWHGFAAFRCTDCEQPFSALLPPLGESLPACPLCTSGPVQLVELLEPAKH